MSVLVVGMGGTIAMSGASGVVLTPSAQQLVDAVPGLGESPSQVAAAFGAASATRATGLAPNGDSHPSGVMRLLGKGVD
jgi:hypothetical protein